MGYISTISINDNAIKLRTLLGEDETSPIDVFSLIQNHEHITMVSYPLSEEVSGMCIKDDDNMIIVVNSSMSIGRQRFTIAHELCHLFFHDENCYICTKKFAENDKSLEYEADIFASFFIAPYGALRSMFGKLKKELQTLSNTVIALEQFYGLSHQAMLLRLYRDGFISKKELESLTQLSPAKLALKLGYSASLYFPDKSREKFTTGKYIRLANEILDQDKISDAKYEELLLDAFRSDLVYGDEFEGLND